MKKATWLSLIEVLFAIIIFSIGILAVLHTIIKTMTTVDKVNVQTQATMLSSQGIQIVHTLRNTNIMKWLPWDCAESAQIKWWIVAKECPVSFAEGYGLRVAMQHSDISDGNPYMTVESELLPDNFADRFDQFQLYAHTWTLEWYDGTLTRYDYNSNDGNPTYYARYISFYPLQSVPHIYDGSEQFVLWVESVVLIKKWSYTGQVVMETILGKIY